MTPAPEDVARPRFSRRLRGYDRQQVDAFIERLTRGLAETAAEREALVERVQRLEELHGDIEDIERVRQETAAAARQHADEVVADARAAAEAIAHEGRRKAAAELERARDVALGIERAVEDLRRYRLDYLERLRAVIAEQLAELERTGELPEPPPQLRATADEAVSAVADEVGGAA
ncbi:MAG: DivIVA domain-containing protein [Actinobacteria bacterium]|nr:DivIVA domain-containing protein [Actinomycetota bacterium]